MVTSMEESRVIRFWTSSPAVQSSSTMAPASSSSPPHPTSSPASASALNTTLLATLGSFVQTSLLTAAPDTLLVGNATSTLPLSGCNHSNCSADGLELEHGVDILAALFLAAMIAIGVPGNASALLVFGWRLPESPFHSLIAALALYDLSACLVHMPLDLTALFRPAWLPAGDACRVSCFLVALNALASSVVLLAVTGVRYRGVVHPLKLNLTQGTARLVAGLALVPALALSWPAFSLFDVSEYKGGSGELVWTCGVAKEQLSRPWPYLYYGTLLTLFAISLLVMAVQYALMARVICRRPALFSSDGDSSPSLKPVVHKSLHTDKRSSTGSNNNSSSSNSSNSSSSSNISSSSSSFQRSVRVKMGTARPVFMMVLVVLVFVLSYAPHFLVMLLILSHDMDTMESVATNSAHGIFTRSYYISNVANPVIYGFWHAAFRRQLLSTCRTARLPVRSSARLKISTFHEGTV